MIHKSDTKNTFSWHNNYKWPQMGSKHRPYYHKTKFKDGINTKKLQVLVQSACIHDSLHKCSLNRKAHSMKTRNFEEYEVQPVNTDRLRKSNMIYIQNLLNKNYSKWKGFPKWRKWWIFVCVQLCHQMNLKAHYIIPLSLSPSLSFTLYQSTWTDIVVMAVLDHQLDKYFSKHFLRSWWWF